MTGTDDAKPWPEGCEFSYITTAIRLIRDGDAYRWVRECDWQWVSPPFTTQRAALFFAEKVPFMSDAEWLESGLPNNPAAYSEHRVIKKKL